jgi:hypothetical protein
MHFNLLNLSKTHDRVSNVIDSAFPLAKSDRRSSFIDNNFSLKVSPPGWGCYLPMKSAFGLGAGWTLV